MLRLILLLLGAFRRPTPFAERLALGNAFNNRQPTTKGDL